MTISQTPSSTQHALTQWLRDTLAEMHAPPLNKDGPKDGPQKNQELSLKRLQTEASFRQFYRITGASQPLVLMESPPDKEQNHQFVAVARAFREQDIRVPEIYAHNERQGWLLLSDLGNTHFIDAYRAGDTERCLYAARNTLNKISAVTDPMIPPYTTERLSDELDIFVDWLVVDACDIELPDKLFNPVRALLLNNAASQPQVCVHRDFHCKNLMLAEEAKSQGDLEVGVLDFQDALIGPMGYDLASLLHDCYWKFPDSVIDSVIESVHKDIPQINRLSIDLLAVQRQLKAIGIFARLASRDGKTSHLGYIEPVLSNLSDLCSRYTELNAFGHWLRDSLKPRAAKWVVATKSLAALN